MHGQLTCFPEVLRSNTRLEIIIYCIHHLLFSNSPSILFFLFSILFPYLLSTCFSLLFSSCHYFFFPFLLSPLPFLIFSSFFLLFPCCSIPSPFATTFSFFFSCYSSLLSSLNYHHHPLPTPYPCASGKKQEVAKKKG